MSIINFPNNPSNGNTYAFNSITWVWNGAAWDRQSTNVVGVTGATGAQGVKGATGATGPVGDYVVSFNGLTGAVTGVTGATGTANQITVGGNTGNITIGFANNPSIPGNLTVTGSNIKIAGTRYDYTYITFNTGITADSVLYPAGILVGRGSLGLTAHFRFNPSPGGINPAQWSYSDGTNTTYLPTSFADFAVNTGATFSGNMVFDAVIAIFGASAANTTPITVYKDNATDNPAVDDGFGSTTFDTPNNKVPLTLSFTEVYDPNTGLTASTPGSIMIRVRDQTAGSDTFTVTDTGGVSCSTAIFAEDIRVRGIRVGLGGGGFTENLAVGTDALASCETGIYNTAVGFGALGSLTVGQDNSAFGAGALQSVQDGNTNTAIGRAALTSLMDGSGNVAIGKQAMNDATHAIGNIAIGGNALLANLDGQYNVAIGDLCLTSGECTGNVANGRSALQHITTGDNNVALGYEAGKRRGTASSTLLSATESIFIGNSARASASAMTREIVIGSNAVGLGSNTTVIGVTSTLGTRIFGVPSTGLTASTIASAATIAPTKTITFISGTTAIVTITAPSLIASTGGQITLIPTGIFTTTTAGNIALASTAVVSKALIMTYDAGTTKWYPSY